MDFARKNKLRILQQCEKDKLKEKFDACLKSM